MEDTEKDKITKEEYHKYLESLFQNAASSGADAISQATLEALGYLAKNYLNLTREMQEIADKIFDGCIKDVGSVIKEAPDTTETRHAKRLLRTLKHELPSASGLIIAIESKAEIKEPILIETRDLFEKYFQLYLDVLYDVSVEESHRGQASFAKLSMLFSCVDELVVCFHLAQHGYINQAYTHIRTVFESLNMVELFVRDESYAELWCSDDEKRKKRELSPVAVRTKLGVKEDPLYAFFSAHGPHVTWEYVQSKSARKREASEKINPEIVFFLGGTKIVVHLLAANVGCVMALFTALLNIGKAFPDRVHAKDYPEIVRGFVKEFREYVKRYVEFFKEAGLDTEDIEAYLNDPDFWVGSGS
jgi:hypothetical protein